MKALGDQIPVGDPLGETWVLGPEDREYGDEIISEARDECVLHGRSPRDTTLGRVITEYGNGARAIAIVTLVGSDMASKVVAFRHLNQFVKYVTDAAANNEAINAVFMRPRPS